MFDTCESSIRARSTTCLKRGCGLKLFTDKFIVVTGGAGFIGSCVIKVLNDEGYDNILVVDNLGISEKWKNLVGKRFYDVIHKNNFFEFISGRETDIEAIIHLGACSNTLELDANYLLENNYHYSVKLAELALQHGHRFIYASSASTYGDGSKGFVDDQEAIDELEPLNMYGYSKHLFDLWAKREKVLHQIVGLKYFNVYGPNEYHKGRMASAIVRMLPEVMEKGTICLFKSDDKRFADGEQKRDFIYVKDAASMTVQFLKNDSGGLYNIGTGRASSWNELARALFQAANKEVNIQYRDMPADMVGKYQNFTEADMTKTKKVLGSGAKTISLDDAVKEYVQAYLSTGKRW